MTAAITAKEQQYARFCEKAGLKQNLNRLYVKGYKRDFEYIKPLRSKPKNDIIKSKRSIIHLSKKEDLSNYDLTKIAPAQDKHVVGTNSYKNLSETRAYAPSYLTISPDKIPELVAKYAGKGVNLYDSHGNWTHTELIVTNDENIGVVVNNLNGKTQEANVFKIHYSQKGVHIVPDYIRKKQRYTI